MDYTLRCLEYICSVSSQLRRLREYSPCACPVRPLNREDTDKCTQTITYTYCCDYSDTLCLFKLFDESQECRRSGKHVILIMVGRLSYSLNPIKASDCFLEQKTLLSLSRRWQWVYHYCPFQVCYWLCLWQSSVYSRTLTDSGYLGLIKTSCPGRLAWALLQDSSLYSLACVYWSIVCAYVKWIGSDEQDQLLVDTRWEWHHRSTK